MRNWLYFTWLSGDHIVEQHMHNLDVMNWVFGGPPVKDAELLRILRELGLKSYIGVPLKMRVAGLNASHEGNAPPLRRLAL